MRIAFTSDVHVDHHARVAGLVAARLDELEADAVLVAGDVSPDPARVRAFLGGLGRRAIFLPGNHDLWCEDSARRYLEELPEMCAAIGAHYLPLTPFTHVNGVLVGQTGWYDYSFADPSAGASIDAYRTGVHSRIRWTDKKYVRWAGLDDESLTRWMAARLGADLAAQRDAGAVVVVTHMLPFRELVPSLPPLFAFVAGFLGAALLGETILGAARAGVPIRRAIAGHLHDRREAIVDGIPAETSPIGYPREYRHSSLEERVRARVRLIASSGGAEADGPRAPARGRDL